MKYRNENYASELEKGSRGTVFSPFRTDYKLNKAKNILVESGKTDVVELIQSYKDCILDSLLDKFLPQEQIGDEVYVANEMLDDLDFMTEITSKAEYYKEKLNLAPETSISEVFKTVKTNSANLSNYLKEVQNEKKIEQESQQKELSQDGTQGA